MGTTAKNNHLFVDAVLYRSHAGIAWRDLPERFGDFHVIHTRHMRWSRSGIWQRVFETLSAQTDNEYAMIDATSLTLSIVGVVILSKNLFQEEKPSKGTSKKEVEKEQARIAAELHDSLGFQLLQAISLLENKPPLQHHPAIGLLENSLLDLRLIVDSLDCQDACLSTQMAMLRHRLSPSLARKGVLLHWSVSDPELGIGTPTALSLPKGHAAQQILKVFQSSLCNTLEHSQASEIWVALHPCNSGSRKNREWDWFLSIEDNGCGFDLQNVLTDASQAGHGIKNMFSRMLSIGADLKIQASKNQGTRILIRWREQDLIEH